MEQGLLAWTLPDKPNSRLQKYRLTPAGRAVLEVKNKDEDGAQTVGS
jgi:hypothetical protein